MLKQYDPDVRGTHVVRVTFMCGEYVGHIAYEMGGNCHGGTLLDVSFLDCDNQGDIANYVENDCQFAFHENYKFYTAVLTNPSGGTLEVDGDSVEFRNMVVGIEFSDFIPE